MSGLSRAYILGAGFSKPANMPLSTELLPLLVKHLQLAEMSKWLDNLCSRLQWISGNDQHANSLCMNIEQVFHFAYFDMEVYRLRQHLEPVRRMDGPGTSWRQCETIEAWLSYLEDALTDVISESDNDCDLAPITRWADSVNENDVVLTFNYDTLAERALTRLRKPWNHGFLRIDDSGNPVFKLHGSIDWIVAHRSDNSSKLDLLFNKENVNDSENDTGNIEDDCQLWRCRTLDQRVDWIEGRDLQSIPKSACPRTVGIAGLGAYKQLHRIPGLGRVWSNGMQALYHADQVVIVGFSMSDFDAMAQMQFAEIAQARARNSKTLPVIVIDPFVDKSSKDRFRRVFRSVNFINEKHETYDWSSLPYPSTN